LRLFRGGGQAEKLPNFYNPDKKTAFIVGRPDAESARDAQPILFTCLHRRFASGTERLARFIAPTQFLIFSVSKL
jgi:hypothetical protein